ncbi:MAG: response regulator receiver modulated metal dependent phosphohydrolase [Chloroflexi bacterium]|nr:response regulator receiver modulated metal dependent phosphohydrolase [Chloroflexota bacterium]
MPAQPQNERILLVDDERAIVDAATAVLTRAGFSVTATTSPQDAIEHAIREPFDLILTDILMPGMNGIELLRTVKHLYPDAAGVMITGHGSMESAIEALRAGATGFLLKPFTAAELRLAVEDALTKSRVLKENLRLKTLMPLYESSKAFYNEMSLDRLTQVIMEQFGKYVGVDHVGILLSDPSAAEPGGFRFQAVNGSNGASSPMSSDLLEWVARTAEPLTVAEGTPSNLPPELSVGPRPGTMLYLPLLASGSLVGIVTVKKNGAGQRFEDGEVDMLSIQASQAAIAIHNAVLMRDLEEGYLDALAALANALEARDIETRGHTERLASHGTLVAKQMALSAADVESVRIGALMHDIGKIGVPDNILRKPGKLTAEEFAIIRQHPIIGDRILAPIPQLQKARGVVLAHHEKFDGTGYPYGLAGDDIPIAARIVTVADVFDAVTESRIYHDGESVVRALEELQKGRGTQLDPKVVDAFFEVLHSVRKVSV